MILLCFATVIAVGLAIPAPPVCELSEWSEWSACTQPKLCVQPEGGDSFPMEEEVWDAGRIKMAKLMRLKRENAKKREECIAKGECPELFKPDSEGYSPCVDGMAGNWPCKNVDLLAFVNFADLGYSAPTARGNDIWGWHDPLNGDEYAIVGLDAGTSFVRVTDPINPVVVGWLQGRGQPSTWRDMKVHANHAFIVSESSGHGMQIFDLTQLRTLNELTELTETAHYSGVGNTHNIAVNNDNGYVYLVGSTQTTGYPNVCSGGLHIVDVNNPTEPRFAACFGDDGYVHDVECVVYHGPDLRYWGHEICFGYNENSLTLMDVTDHDNPLFISKMGYSTSRYTHQGWITEDHTVVLLDDELDEMYTPNKNTATYIWDVTDLEYPLLMNTYYSSETAIDHNQYISGDLTFQSNYEAGLRILYIDHDNYTLEEVAYFDMLPDSTEVNFAGTWSNYPWFANGMVASNSIDYGLFLQQPDYEAINEEIAAKKRYAEQVRTRKILSNHPGQKCAPRVEVRECDPNTAC